MSEQTGSGGDQRPEAKQAWSDAGERLSGLGSKLKQHYEAQSGASGVQPSAEVKDAAKKLGEAVQTAFEAIGNAAKDPGVKDDVKHVGRSVADALVGTFAGVSEELRKTFGRQEASGWAGPTDNPTAPPTATPTGTPPGATTSGVPEPGAPTPGPAEPASPTTAPPPSPEPEFGPAPTPPADAGPPPPAYGSPPEPTTPEPPVEPSTGLPDEPQR